MNKIHKGPPDCVGYLTYTDTAISCKECGRTYVDQGIEETMLKRNLAEGEEKRIADAVAQERKEWVVAFAEALGTDSELKGPTCAGGVKECIEEVRKSGK